MTQAVLLVLLVFCMSAIEVTLFTLNLGIVFGILDYSVDYSASSDIRLMTKIRILYSAVFVDSVLQYNIVITENGFLLPNS